MRAAVLVHQSETEPCLSLPYNECVIISRRYLRQKLTSKGESFEASKIFRADITLAVYASNALFFSVV